MQFSRTLAIVFGVLVPIAETVRRWSTWQEFPPALFDDYVLGALLMYSACVAGHDFRRGQAFLTAAWGFSCGLGQASFFGQLHRLQLGEPDPAPIPSTWVAVIKGSLFAVAIIALILTLQAKSLGSAGDGMGRKDQL